MNKAAKSKPKAVVEHPLKSPLSYLGGKSRIAKAIAARFPPHQCYVEPFCGAAWVYYAKPPSPVEVLNDQDGELVNFWRVVKNHLPELNRYLKHTLVSRLGFETDKATSPEILTDVQRAARYYRLQRMGFGGRTTGRTFGTSVQRPSSFCNGTNPERLEQAHARLAKTTVENLDAIKCIEKYDSKDSLFYLDPPYWNADFYAVSFQGEDFIRLRDALSGIEGKFILSLNDTPEVRELFREFTIEEISTKYSVSNPRRSKATRGKERIELLIHNLDTVPSDA